MHSISVGVAAAEAIVYLAYAAYLIYRPIKTVRMKKNQYPKHVLISNPASPAASAVPFFSLILCLPSILVMYFLADAADFMGICIYLAVFIFFMGLGIKLLFSAKGDYYLDSEGIHFLRNENGTIRFSDIEKSRWSARNFSVNNRHIASVTKLVVKGRNIKIYNLTEAQYRNHIASDNIYETINRKVIAGPLHKAFIACFVILFICGGISFSLFMSYASQYGGDAINAVGNQGLAFLWMHADVQHYLADGGTLTAVSYQAWRQIVIFEVTSMALIPLAILCGFVNAVWYAISANRTKKKDS